ncbi:MAG: Holliday junction branch migration DNA helicase RuvB [Patescibacteria group bacterium]|nr:Holliday junction branch migration DNA helicase RuvB [Patescibacteria group bacterium]
MVKKENIIDNTVQDEEKVLDLSLRPLRLVDYIGQDKVKESISIFIQAAQKRSESIEHVLIYGGPGLGKTTLAHIIAREMGTGIQATSGPAIERTGDLASILTNLTDGDILFIDEIHRLARPIEETLYSAMEDFALDLVLGKGPSAKTLKIDLPRFTLIGATTRIGLISSPLRDRFGAIHHLDFYNEKDLQKIISRSAKILNIKIDKSAIEEIAKRSRFTPRIANRILKRVRDFAQVKGQEAINRDIAQKALEILDIDRFGLDKSDRTILEIIIDKFNSGPVGLTTLSAATHEDKDTIEEVYEPYLMQLGFLERTPKGRKVTARALDHLGKNKKLKLL